MTVSRMRPPDPGVTPQENVPCRTPSVIKRLLRTIKSRITNVLFLAISLVVYIAAVKRPAFCLGWSAAWRRTMQTHGGARGVYSPVTPKFHSQISATLLALTLIIAQPEISSCFGIGSRHVDLIESLQLWNTTYNGLTVIPGPRPIAPAIFLQGDSRDVRLPIPFQTAAEALLTGTKEFTVMATVQQEEKNAGTILAFSKGQQRYLELQSSGRKDEIRLHYVHNGAVHVEVFPFKLADQRWHKVAVMVSGTQVEVWVDCNRVFRRLAPPPVTNFTLLASMEPLLDSTESFVQVSNSDVTFRNKVMSLYLGQRNPGHFLYKGALQDVRVVEGAAGHLLQCPQAEAQCPTCGGFQLLTEQVAALQDLVMQLTQKVTSTQERLASIEECDCQKSCRVNGSVRQDGATWKSGCEICSCRHGEVTCRPVPCPNLTCKNPVYTEGECCPVCLKQCSLKGVVYDHGETVSPRQCVDCECRDGKMQCRRIDPEAACPELPCPLSEQFSVPGECCKFCPGVNYCNKGHTCHANASCINLQTTYTCHCNQGFTGDGGNCQDIDECQAIGAHHGHYCQAHTSCINSVGSYKCQCEEGFSRQDEFSCADHDECEAGMHQCHEHSSCINTRGSYKCQCLPGYEGDGIGCFPVCNDTCLNGGVCVAPDICICRSGFTGNSCELDVDECNLGLHHCPSNSECVNLPGWYTCHCSSGFSPINTHGSFNQMCQDIDECHIGTHTCNPTAICRNTEGSFECLCKNSTNCSQSCVTDGKESSDGGIWTPEGSECTQCQCSGGKITCDKINCNCSSSNISNKCCPQCDSKTSCHHQGQEVSLPSGHRWIDQCQTCECLVGEIDCWPLECPPLTCFHPIRVSGDCCPRCPDDPCSAPSIYNTTLVSRNSTPPVPLDSNNPQPCHYFMSQAMEWSSLMTGSRTLKCQMPYCSELMGRGGAGTLLRINNVLVFIPALLLVLGFSSSPRRMMLQTNAVIKTASGLLMQIVLVLINFYKVQLRYSKILKSSARKIDHQVVSDEGLESYFPLLKQTENRIFQKEKCKNYNIFASNQDHLERNGNLRIILHRPISSKITVILCGYMLKYKKSQHLMTLSRSKTRVKRRIVYCPKAKRLKRKITFFKKFFSEKSIFYNCVVTIQVRIIVILQICTSYLFVNIKCCYIM